MYIPTRIDSVHSRSRKTPRALITASAILIAAMLPTTAQAKSHLWDILSVYSNADGNIRAVYGMQRRE